MLCIESRQVIKPNHFSAILENIQLSTELYKNNVLKKDEAQSDAKSKYCSKMDQ